MYKYFTTSVLALRYIRFFVKVLIEKNADISFEFNFSDVY